MRNQKKPRSLMCIYYLTKIVIGQSSRLVEANYDTEYIIFVVQLAKMIAHSCVLGN